MGLDSYLANITGTVQPQLMAKVCSECPWRKVDNVNQHVPAAGEAIFNIVKNLTPMSCHMSQTQLVAEADQRGLHRCRGIEAFRANIGVTSDIQSDCETVFANEGEALSRWAIFPLYHDWVGSRLEFFRQHPFGTYIDEKEQKWVAGKLIK